jgi:hypothetical protein
MTTTRSPATSRWPRRLRRGFLEGVGTVLIAVGVLMLLQPFSMTLFRYSFVTTLFGTAFFTVVSKFPE